MIPAFAGEGGNFLKPGKQYPKLYRRGAARLGIIRHMGQELGIPQVPCVYCGHVNSAGQRFCGMCGKALPDLVKLAKPAQGAGGRPSGQTAGAPAASPHPASPAPVRPTPAARADNPNRDLSYLLHDDHVPAQSSRAPFLLGGLVLAAVAVFFFMRGGSKPAPAVGSGAGDATASQAAPAGADAPPAETKVEPPKAEAPKAEVPKAEPAPAETPADDQKGDPEKAEIPPAAAATVPAQEVRRPVPAVTTAHAKPAPRPSRMLKKPSPAKPVAPEVETVAAEDSSATPGGDCEKQIPAMRKAAAHGDAKAKADLGLVYYAGQCVPRDLPTAYHWYALALRTAPDSPQISAQLEAIWKQMSPAERQLALKPQ